MLKKAQFMVPAVVSFNQDGSLDLQGNANIADFLIEGGADGLLIMGSTGEFYSMPMEDKRKLIDSSVDIVHGRARLFFGTNCMRLQDTVALSNYALDAGAEGVMIIGPYYFSVDDQALEQYYDDLCDNIHGPVFLYNYPERTGYDFPPQIALNLLRKHKNIMGFKDSHSQFGHTRQLAVLTKDEFPDFEIYSGYGENFYHLILSGGAGCIEGLGNIYPEIFSGFARAINAGDIPLIERYQKLVNRMYAFYSYGTPFMPLCKEAMIRRGVKISPYCQHPMQLPTKEQLEKIEAFLQMVETEAGDLLKR